MAKISLFDNPPSRRLRSGFSLRRLFSPIERSDLPPTSLCRATSRSRLSHLYETPLHNRRMPRRRTWSHLRHSLRHSQGRSVKDWRSLAAPKLEFSWNLDFPIFRLFLEFRPCCSTSALPCSCV